MGYFNNMFEVDRLKIKNKLYLQPYLVWDKSGKYIQKKKNSLVIHLDKSSKVHTLIIHLDMCRKFTMMKLSKYATRVKVEFHGFIFQGKVPRLV